MEEIPQEQTRRGWLLRGLAAVVSGTLIAVFYPVVRFLRPRSSTVSGAGEVVAPFKVNELPSAPGNPFSFGGKPCLIVLTPMGASRLKSGERLTSEDVRAFNAVCTHLDCTVKYRPNQQDIFCPCHDGVYDLNGKNISGPPPRPLEEFKVTLRGEVGNEEIVVFRNA